MHTTFRCSSGTFCFVSWFASVFVVLCHRSLLALINHFDELSKLDSL
jgi:hypothetical protein